MGVAACHLLTVDITMTGRLDIRLNPIHPAAQKLSEALFHRINRPQSRVIWPTPNDL